MSHSSQTLLDHPGTYNWATNYSRRRELSNTVTAFGGAQFRAEIPSGAVQVTRSVDVVSIAKRLLERLVFDSAFVINSAVEVSETIVVQSAKEFPIWMTVLGQPATEDRFSALSKIINSLVDDLQSDAARVDERFLQIEVKDKQASLLVSVLSTSFSWRPVLRNWGKLRDRIVAELKTRNIDGLELALKGLLE